MATEPAPGGRTTGVGVVDTERLAAWCSRHNFDKTQVTELVIRIDASGLVQLELTLFATRQQAVELGAILHDPR